jgi:YD repeat-containing protein
MYDAAHRLTGIRDALGNRIAYQLDPMGNRTREDITDGSGRLAQTRSRSFDASNRLAQDIGAAGQITRYGYDNAGNLTSVTDPLGGVVAHSFDALNRIARVIDPANGVIDFTYDGLDQLASVTDPRRLATTYKVNGLGERSAESSPDSGQTRMAYDSGGNVHARTDARDQRTVFKYDALNRVTRATFDDGTQIRYAYDQGPNARGRLATLVQDSGYPMIQWIYDAHGRVETETLTDLPSPGAPPLTLRQGFVHDGAGRLAQRIYPSGQKVSYTYDASGRIASIAYGGAIVLQGTAYHPFGPASGWRWGNSRSHERRFDREGRIVSYPIGHDVRHLGYDAASRITRISQGTFEPFGLRRSQRDAHPAPALDQHFDYDRLDRLVRSVDGRESRVYRYDANGNRLAVSLNGERSVHSVSARSMSRIGIKEPGMIGIKEPVWVG